MGSVFNNIFCMGRGRFFCIRYGWKDLFKKIFIWMEIVYRMEKGLYDALQVRFIKLHFTVAFLQDSQLPEDKVSAIRGGMGEMLLRMNCIRDRQCESCDFEPECIVQRTMYSKFEKTQDSHCRSRIQFMRSNISPIPPLIAETLSSGNWLSCKNATVKCSFIKRTCNALCRELCILSLRKHRNLSRQAGV